MTGRNFRKFLSFYNAYIWNFVSRIVTIVTIVTVLQCNVFILKTSKNDQNSDYFVLFY